MGSQNLLWFFFLIGYPYCLALTSMTIGVLTTEESPQLIYPLTSVMYEKNDQGIKSFYKNTTEQVSKYNSYEASRVLCNILNEGEGVAAIFGVDSLTSGILQSISERFNIPYLITSWRANPIEKDSTVLNFFPEPNLFAQGLTEMVRSLHWNSFVILYETEEGLIRMQKLLSLQEYEEGYNKKNIFVKQLVPGGDHRSMLKEIGKLREINIILDCATEHILPILQQAKDMRVLDILTKVFITSLDAHILNYTSVKNGANITTIRIFNDSIAMEDAIKKWEHSAFLIDKTMECTNGEIKDTHPLNYTSIKDNITTIRIFNNSIADLENSIEKWENSTLQMDNTMEITKCKIKTETVLFHDALLLLMDSLGNLTSTEDIRTNPVSCNGRTQSKIGYTIVNDMKSRNASLTLSGPLEFDEYGNRIDFNLTLVYINDTQVDDIAIWNAKTNILNLTSSSNNTDIAAIVNLQSILVQVYTKKGPPYLFEKEGEDLKGNDRYEGYSVDLIDEVAKIIDFKYEIHLTKDNEYGNLNVEKGKWTGLIGDLLEKRAHLALCDLTITHQRRAVVDFSLPFMALGIGILYKEPDKEEVNRFAFLEPFSILVWIYTATLYLIIAVVLYFTARITPGDWENPNPNEENPEELENKWDIKNSLWLVLGSIMTQGSDILTKGISSRMLVSMWWFFSLVMANSYMANLTAFLTKNRMELTISGAEALSKQTKIKYGAVTGGSTQAFFQSSTYPTYERMWINMISSYPSVFEATNADGVRRVEKQPYAFLMESTQIDYVTETKCNLKQVGDLLDSKSYGIAMPMNAPYRSFINEAILKLQENGKLAELKEKWWKEMRKEPSCIRESHEDADSGKLDLTNVGGAFLVLVMGLAMAIIIGVSGFLWNVRNVALEEHTSYWQALKVEVHFACAIWITKKRVRTVKSDSSSSSSTDTKETLNL